MRFYTGFIGSEIKRFSPRMMTNERYAAGPACSNFLFGLDGAFCAGPRLARAVGIEATVRW